MFLDDPWPSPSGAFSAMSGHEDRCNDPSRSLSDPIAIAIPDVWWELDIQSFPFLRGAVGVEDIAKLIKTYQNLS